MSGVVQNRSHRSAEGRSGSSRPCRANVRAGSLRRHGANAVTSLRLVLTPLFLWVVQQAYHGGPCWVAGLLFVVIAASDVLDGTVARAAGSASRRGRLFDHVTDLAFVFSSLLLFVEHGVVPWWVPTAVGASFALYVADSWRRSDAAARLDLQGTRIGHAGGIVNYVVIGALVGNDVCRFRVLGESALHVLFGMVLLVSAASVLTRLLFWRRTGG
jgi:phosphatidylglycerophosphate synthase